MGRAINIGPFRLFDSYHSFERKSAQKSSLVSKKNYNFIVTWRESQILPK